MRFYLDRCANKFSRIGITAVAALSLGAMPIRICAQQNSCTQKSVFINVTDDKGQSVPGLTAANFRVTAGKQIISVLSAAPAPPRRIAILLDQSGSMFDDFLYRTSASVVTTMLQRSAPDIEFAFATYANDFRVRKDLTSNHEELIEVVKHTLSDKSTIWGPSAMLDAAERGLEMFTSPKVGDAVLLVSDGGENTSTATRNDVGQRFAGSDVRLLAAIIKPPNLRGYSAEAAEKGMSAMKKLADLTDGEIYLLGAEYSASRPNQKEIKFPIALDYHNVPEAVDGILRNMATTYQLQISLPAELRKPEEWKVEITGSANGATFVRYPAKIYPCRVAAKRK